MTAPAQEIERLRAAIRFMRPLAECNALDYSDALRADACHRIAVWISSQDYDAPELMACTEHAELARVWHRWRMGEQLASMLEGMGL